MLRVRNIADLFYMAEVLAKQPSPRGPRLTILTNAGGPGVLATDALITEGGELAELSADTMDALNQILPAAWSHNNPIDILGDASPERYAKAVEIAAKDPNSDGMLVVLTPQAMTDPTQTAEHLKPYAKVEGKPILASWMGGADVSAGESILNRADIPTFPYPDTAARAFNYMWRYSYNLRGLYETPTLPEDSAECTPNRTLAEEIIHKARAAGPHHPDRVRIERSPALLLHSDGRDHRGRSARRRRSKRPKRSATRSSSSCIPKPSRTRRTWAA